jgi:hypothetical protein
MSQVKRCKQCGLLKEVIQFRSYTYAKKMGTEGKLSICKDCENINTIYKRAMALLNDNREYFKSDNFATDPKMEKAVTDAQKINRLYDTLEARGLHTPRQSQHAEARDPITDSIEKLQAFYDAPVQAQRSNAVTFVVPVLAPESIPDDLKYWLDEPFSTWQEKGLDPEYLQETVYESLKAKYRPQIGVNKETYLPVYDDTYKTQLNAILKRFDEYEEESIDGGNE